MILTGDRFPVDCSSYYQMSYMVDTAALGGDAPPLVGVLYLSIPSPLLLGSALPLPLRFGLWTWHSLVLSLLVPHLLSFRLSLPANNLILVSVGRKSEPLQTYRLPTSHHAYLPDHLPSHCLW